MQKIEAGKIYRHFKGNLYKVIGFAKHSETLEDMVVYTHDGTTWVRPYSMFSDKVDKEKYPNCKQEYRFVKIDD